MLTKLASTDSRHVVPYPPEQSEFEVQAFLYSSLKNAGLNVRGEINVRGDFGFRKRGLCRFDIVIYDEHEQPTLIIEVKSYTFRRASKPIENTRQAKKYRQFGIPVWFVYGMHNAELAILELTNPP